MHILRKQRVVTKYGEISNWDVSNVTNMENMFELGDLAICDLAIS